MEGTRRGERPRRSESVWNGVALEKMPKAGPLNCQARKRSAAAAAAAILSERGKRLARGEPAWNTSCSSREDDKAGKRKGPCPGIGLTERPERGTGLTQGDLKSPTLKGEIMPSTTWPAVQARASLGGDTRKGCWGAFGCVKRCAVLSFPWMARLKLALPYPSCWFCFHSLGKPSGV